MPDALMVTSSFLPGRGGIESYLAQLCSDLSPRLAVLAPGCRDGAPIPAGLGYEVHGYGGSMLVPNRRVAGATESIAAGYGIDRVLFGTPWPLGLLGLDLRRRGLRYGVIVHGAELLVPGAVPLLGRHLARCMASADLLLPVSDYTATKLRALIERHHLRVPPIEFLRARVDLERFSPEADGSRARSRLELGDDRVILCFGRLVKRKGVHRLIEALEDISRRVPRAVLVVGGTGPELPSLERLARRRAAPVRFAGRVAEADVPGFYAMADVFALPVADRAFGLEIEGLGVVLLEAAACGLPCVTGRSGGTPEAVIDGETGRVVDATDRAQLVDAIAGLLEEPQRAADMGAAGRTHVAAAFSAQTSLAPLLSWLDDGIR